MPEAENGSELETLVDARGALAGPRETQETAAGRFTKTGMDSGGAGDDGNDEEQDPVAALVRACQTGDLETVARIVASGRAKANAVAADGTTPLHWAAVNNRLSVCEFLVRNGAEVDARGGDLQGTPLHWACRSGHVYIAHLLVSNGADVNKRDVQGFNALHLATHSSNVMLVIYLLHENVQPDSADEEDRTAAHWAAYQGDTFTLDVLLQWRAGLEKGRDKMGFTPLHWAIVRGHEPCMRLLVEEGADLAARTNEGKTPAELARDGGRHIEALWERALKATGRDPATGAPRSLYLTRKQADFIIFCSSLLTMPVVWGLFGHLAWFYALPLAAVSYYAFLRLLSRFVFSQAYFAGGAILTSPYLSGIFFASCAYTMVAYLYDILPATFGDAFFLNLLFIVFFALALYAFFRTMFMDPGYIPRASFSERRDSIHELIADGDFDSLHFCIATLTAKPLRSKYDRKSKQLVARFDHYCPWTNNAVGLRNHRMFIVYIVALMVGLILFAALYFGAYAQALPDVSNQTYCGIYPEGFCALVTYAPSYTALAVWATLQLVWVSLLTFVQLYNVARGLTTFESTNLHRFGRVGTEHFSSLPADHPSAAAARLSATVRNAGAVDVPHTRCWTPFLRLLGVDQFANSARDAFGRGIRSKDFPSNYGLRTNCMDFWFPNGDYLILREPPGGYAALGGAPVDYYRISAYPKRGNGYAQV